MGFEFHDHESAARVIRERIASREWWTIVVTPGADALQRMVEKVERTYYAGAANVDFEVVQVPHPDGMILIYFAKKPRLTLAALQAALDGEGIPTRVSEQADLLYTDERPELMDAFFVLADPKAAMRRLRQTIHKNVTSKEWWAFVWTDQEGYELPLTITRELFPDGVDGDFRIMRLLLPNVTETPVGVAFVRKSRMQIEDLKYYAAKWGAQSPEKLNEPIIFAGEVPDGVRYWFFQVAEGSAT